jgi:hypothetical protein
MLQKKFFREIITGSVPNLEKKMNIYEAKELQIGLVEKYLH